MRRQISLVWLSCFSILVLAMYACGGGDEPSPPPLREPPPNIEATVEAKVREQLAAIALLTPTPSTTPDVNEALVGDFSRRYAAIAQEWDAFHGAYQSWRQGLTGQGTCGEAAIRARLRGFAAEFSSQVSSRVNRLPVATGLQAPHEALGEAASTEELALRTLSETWVPGAPEGFLTYATTRGEVDRFRRQAREAFAEVPEDTPDEKVEEFSRALDSVTTAWESFRREYDAWRRTDGDCDTQAVATALEGFVEQFRGIAQKTFALPASAFVRSQAQLLAEAADRELQALTTLRDTWKPYDRSYFTSFEGEMASVGRLRRQVAGALEDLLLQYQGTKP